MYSDFMEKKVVNIWGSNFSSVALKKSKKVNSSVNKTIEEIGNASYSVCSKNILNKKLSDKKTNF